MRAIDGGDVRFGAAFETGFRSTPDAPTPFVPGPDAQFQSLQATQNGQRIRMPYSRRSLTIEPGTFRGSWGWQFTASTGHEEWLKAILGEPSSGVYSGKPVPMSFFLGYVPHDVEEVIEGAVATSATVSPQVGQPGAQVTVEGFYADRYQAGADDFQIDAQPSVTGDVLRYQDATLTADGDERLIVQDAQLSLQWPSLQGIDGFGDRTFVGYEVNDFEPSLSYTAVSVDPREANQVYGSNDSSMGSGPADPGDLVLDLTRDGGGITFTGTGGFNQSYSEDSIGDSQSRVDESLDYDLTDLEAEVT